MIVRRIIEKPKFSIILFIISFDKLWEKYQYVV